MQYVPISSGYERTFDHCDCAALLLASGVASQVDNLLKLVWQEEEMAAEAEAEERALAEELEEGSGGS